MLLESSCVGIDLGTESIKAAYLVKRNNRIKTLDLYQMENPVGNTVFNTPKEQEIIKKCFMKINNIFPCKDVVIGVPSKHAVFRHVQFPLLSKKELREAIFWETQEFSTIFNSEFISDYELLDKQKDIYNVLLVGVTKDIITNYIKIAHDVNFHLRALDVYPLANARVLRTQKASKVIAIVDLQSSYSEITVVANGKIVFNRNLDFRFTTTVKNEMYDIITTYSNSSDFIRNEVRTLPQHFQNLLLEISRSINFYSLHSKGCQVDELLLIGKGIELQNCKDIIKNFLGIKVNTTKEFKFEFMNKNIELNHKIIDYFSALGFALRGRG
ncbi:MAG: pilus assembly protein PilM [Tepidanaerobacteraceae bacterium]|nr:pilus assembly protein PilM [Tepidanaerobacteraceae bacterium]